MTVKIYHNPRCSKSRQTLDLLIDRGIEPETILYMENPPCVDEVLGLAKLLGLSPLGFTRTKETLFKELGLSKKDERSDEEWAKLLAENPRLIERPIVVANGKAALGRPPENVLGIL
ncbi:MAG: arsenate reductase [Bradymonadia bacterium]|jgi:arsenate reductase